MYVPTQEMSCINEKYANQYYQKEGKSLIFDFCHEFLHDTKNKRHDFFDFIDYQSIN